MKKIILTFIAMLLAGVNTALAQTQNVAKIGSTEYPTLQEAFAAVATGQQIDLLTDVTLAAPMDLELAGKKVTLDLGGKTLTGRTNLKSGELLIQNGNIAGGNQQALNVYGSATAGAENYSVLTIANDVAVTADVFGVCLFGPTATAPAGYGAVINIAGSVSTNGNGSDGAVFVSGNLGKNISGDMNNKIDILGTVTSQSDAAIALNGNATVTVDDGATITGNTAIAIKRGTLNVTGGTIRSTGASNIPPAGYMNGTEMSGAGISMTNTYNQYGGMSVEITGGTITSENAVALYKEDDAYTNDATITVEGGTFSSDVSDFLATDHIISQKANGDFIVLSQADAVAEIGTNSFYASLEDAFAAVQDEETITLLKDVNLTERLFVNAGDIPAYDSANKRYATTTDNKSITLNLNDHDITSSSNIALAGGTLNIVNNGSNGGATISTTAAGLAPVEIYGKGDLTQKRTLTVGEGVILSGPEYGLNIFGSNNNQKNTIDVTVNGTVNGILFVLGNLSNAENDINIVVNGVVDASNAETGNKPKTGIALNGNAKLTVNEGANVTGETGIEVRAGKLIVNGGNITATADAYSYQGTGSGTTSKGAAIAVAKHNTPCNIEVSINGGELVGPELIAVYDALGNGLEGVSVTASKGFVTNTETKLPEGYCWKSNGNGTYSVGLDAEAQIISGNDTTPYLTLAEAFAAVEDGDIIELLKNVTLGSNIGCPLTSGKIYFKFGGFTVDKGNDNYHVILTKANGNGARALVPSDAPGAGAIIYTDEITDIFAAAAGGTILTGPSDDPSYSYFYQAVADDEENAIARNEQTGMLFDDLQTAVDLAQAGQTIKLLPAIEGVTIENTVVINKNITIDGQGDEGDNLQVKSDAKVAFEVTGPGSVTFNKVDINAKYYEATGAENSQKSGSRAIKVDQQFSDSLVINYSTIMSTGRGIDVYDVNGGFVLDVKHSNIEAILQDGDEKTAGYINSFDTDPDGRGRGINFSHKAASIVANIQFSKIQGYAYPVHVWNKSGKVELNMTDCSTWGRNIINNEGDNSTFNLKNVTSHSYNNESSNKNEAFAAIVDYNTADLNIYNIEDLKVVAVVKAADIDPTSATQNFIDLRGTNATVKITGNSGYVTSDTDTNLSKEIRDRVGFVNKLITETDVIVGEFDAYKRMIDKTVNNRIYFDDESKSYFNFWFEIMEPFEYDYDNDTKDELIRIAIDDKKDYTNLYPVVPLEVKVKMTAWVDDVLADFYFNSLEDAFNSDLFGFEATIQLLAKVDLNKDINVRLERGEAFTLILDPYDVTVNKVLNEDDEEVDASIKLPPLVTAYSDDAQAEELFTSADETLAVIKGANNGVSGLIKYYVPANVYYADSYKAATGDPTVEDPEDPNYYQGNIDGGLLWIFKDLLSTDADAMLQITPDCYVRLEANVTLDETYTLPIGGDVDNEEVFYLDLNGKAIEGEYKSLVMRLGTAIYTTGTVDIFSSIDPEYTVVYDVLDTPITTTYTDFEGNSKTVSFTHKYYLVKDGLAVIVDPSTYCGDRLTPNFIVKKKVVDAVTGEESWVVLEDETDYTWSLVPPASDDADDKTYIDAKTYVQAIVIEGISFQGTRKADFTILPRDIKDVTASGNEQPWREAGYTPEQIKDLIKLIYYCNNHENPANPELVKDVDYRISVAGESAQSAINYTYPASTPYTYKGTFVQADATTVDYYITPANASVAKNLVGDVARFLGALYRASGVTSITYDGVTYSWSTEPDEPELKGSNWRDASNTTLVSVIAGQFSPTNMPESLTITTDKGKITVNIHVTNESAPAPASTGMYLDVDTYPQVITITAIEGGNYTGTLKLDFTILPEDMIDISKCMVISDATYTSAPLPPTQNRIAVIYKQTAVVADVPTEVEFVLPAEAYTIEVHGALDSYVDAKTYSNAITIVANPDYNVGTDDDPLRFYGSLDADYVIKQRDLADDSDDPEENDNEGIVTLEAYAGEDAPETDPATIYLKWTGDELVPVINGPAPENADDPVTNNINLILNAKKDLAEGQTEADDVEWKLIPADYSYTIEPAPMVDPGIYKVIFTGRGNFTGMREVNVMVLKDINGDNMLAEVPMQIILGNEDLNTTDLQDVVIKDENLGTTLVEGVHYELEIRQGGDEPADIIDAIKGDGVYYAHFKGLEPYYMNDQEVKFPAVFEYYSWDAKENSDGSTAAPYYNNQTYPDGYTVFRGDDPAANPVSSIHVQLPGKDMKATIGGRPGYGAAIDNTLEDFTLDGLVTLHVEEADGTEYAPLDLTVVGIDDDAFMGCNDLHWLDATAIEGYTPENLSRTETGPFNGYPVQSLVYLDGTQGGDVTGTNYIYKKGDDDFRCEELKIYDDLLGNQQQIRENEGTYKWDFRNIYEFVADKVTNTRVFLAEQHYTTCLPYKLQMPASMKAYTLDAASDNIFGFIELSLSELNEFTPYLLIPSKGGNLLNNDESTVVYVTPTADQGQLTPKDTPTGHKMFGSMIYMDNDAAAGMYIMQSKNTWMKIDAGSSYNGACILPMRAYIQLPDGSPAREYITATFTSGVETINAEVNDDWTNAEVYDLQGRKVDTTARLPKGVYIVNGQKRIRK
jgi:hypothetical protein